MASPGPGEAEVEVAANPDSYRATVPLIGCDLTFEVDLTTSGHTHALVIGFDSPFELVLAGGQTLLCLDLLGGGELANTGLHTRAAPVWRTSSWRRMTASTGR